MKITKVNNTLIESELPETGVNTGDASVTNVQDASVSEIADAIQTAKAIETAGEQTYSDESATKLATELKTAAKGLNSAIWAPLSIKNELTDKLDRCLAAAMTAQKSGLHDGSDLLVNGLPGSAKTGIVGYWAKARGVNLVELDSNDDELGAIIKGFPIDTIKKDQDGNEYHATDRSYSAALDDLDEPMSVLFLDEFNRAPQSLRANLLKLINSHEIPGKGTVNGKKGRRRFDNLLFTIACINPVTDSDFGVIPLNDAEKSRFAVKTFWDSTKKVAGGYLDVYLQDIIDGLDKNDPDYAYLYTYYKRIQNIAKTLLASTRFDFDQRSDLDALANDDANMLNQRSLTDGLMMAAGHGKAAFLDWVDKDSGFLQKNIDAIHAALDYWVEPKIVLPDDAQPKTTSKAQSNNEVSTNSNTSTNVAGDANDFDSKFGPKIGNNGESDTGAFTQGNGVDKSVYKVSSAEAERRILNHDFAS